MKVDLIFASLERIHRNVSLVASRGRLHDPQVPLGDLLALGPLKLADEPVAVLGAVVRILKL